MKTRRAVVGLVMLAALVTVGTVGAAGSSSFTDRAGDSGLAPDIVRVDVSNDDKGVLTFALKFANRTALQGDDGVLIYLVGNPDYVIFADWQERMYGLGRWNGSDFDFDVPQTTLSTTDGMTFKVNRSDLGGLSGFAFYAMTFAGYEGEGYAHVDRAPDDIAGMLHVWPYQLVFTPELRSVAPVFTPARPKAGRRFAVTGARITLGTGKKVAAQKLVCTAKLAGKKLPPAGRCAWQIPAAAAGKKLSVTVTVTYQGAKGTAGPWTFTVGR